MNHGGKPKSRYVSWLHIGMHETRCAIFRGTCLVVLVGFQHCVRAQESVPSCLSDRGSNNAPTAQNAVPRLAVVEAVASTNRQVRQWAMSAISALPLSKQEASIILERLRLLDSLSRADNAWADARGGFDYLSRREAASDAFEFVGRRLIQDGSVESVSWLVSGLSFDAPAIQFAAAAALEQHVLPVAGTITDSMRESLGYEVVARSVPSIAEETSGAVSSLIHHGVGTGTTIVNCRRMMSPDAFFLWDDWLRGLSEEQVTRIALHAKTSKAFDRDGHDRSCQFVERIVAPSDREHWSGDAAKASEVVNAARDSGSLQVAAATLRKSIEALPKSPMGFRIRALGYMTELASLDSELGNLQEAAATYRELLAVYTSSRYRSSECAYDASFELAGVYQKWGFPELAEKQLHETIAYIPDSLADYSVAERFGSVLLQLARLKRSADDLVAARLLIELAVDILSVHGKRGSPMFLEGLSEYLTLLKAVGAADLVPSVESRLESAKAELGRP